MQRLVFVILGVIFAGAIAYSVMQSGKAPPPEHGGTTADRISERQRARLVERPMELVERGELAAGQKEFEREYAAMLAKKGEQSITLGDMLTAFGVGLWREDHEAEAVPYFRRAVAAYRKAVGPDDPEVALALNSMADSIYDWDEPTAPPPEVMEAMRETLRIRRASLGPKNAETAVTYVRLGRLNGHPEVAKGDPARVEAAAAQARHGLELLPQTPNLDPSDIGAARRAVAEIYARNGRTQETLAAVEAYRKGNHALTPIDIKNLEGMLAAAGDPAGAKELKARFGRQD